MDRYDYIGNPALKPEHNTQVDLTYNARIGKVSMQASVYYSYLSNYISARVYANVKKVSSDVLGVKRFVNVSRAEMTGFETSVTLPLVPAVRSTVTLAYTHGQNKDINEPLPEMPPFTAAVLMQYQPGEDREWVELEGRFVARQSRISSSFLESATPGFGVISLRGGMRLMEHLSLGAAITNLFDKAYYEHLNRLNKADGHGL